MNIKNLSLSAIIAALLVAGSAQAAGPTSGQIIIRGTVMIAKGDQLDAPAGGLQDLLATVEQSRAFFVIGHQFLQRELAVLQYVNDLFEFAHCLLEAHPGFGNGGGFGSGHGREEGRPAGRMASIP